MKSLTLYPHQEKFLKENPNKALLAWDTGTGKSLAAMEWMKKRPNEYFVIIVPKNIKAKWLKDIESMDPLRVLLLTKEEFKTFPSRNWSGIVVDEADFFGSALFKKGRSELSEKLYNDIMHNNIEHVLLMTATPFRNQPHTIHSLFSYLDLAPTWKDWQSKHYALVRRPYNPRPFYEPKKYWRISALSFALPRMYTAKISDISTVPEQHNEQIDIPTEVPVNVHEDNAVKEWHAYARAENGKEKLDWIKNYLQGKSKVVVVCRYKEQIAMYAKELAKETEVFVLTGDVKDQGEVIEQAKKSFECVFLIQASIGAGFQLAENPNKCKENGYYNFSHMIFASMSFSHRDYVQMKGRILRGDALQENWYVHVLGGKKDEAVYKVVMKGEDFNIE